jgi:hypothetical protein
MRCISHQEKRCHLVDDDHRPLEQCGFEGGGAARHQHDVGGHHRLMRMPEQQADRQLLRLTAMQRGFEEQARFARRQRHEEKSHPGSRRGSGVRSR